MDNAEALRKISKLLRLSQSSNANEAASAAAMAQDLMQRHGISQAAAQLDGTEARAPEEPIMDFSQRDGGSLAVMAGSKLETWRGFLAQVITSKYACRVVQHRRSGPDGEYKTLEIIGRPSDVETVRYLYTWLANETDRLTDVHGTGMGYTWRNNFRLGVVDAIRMKLDEQEDRTRSAIRTEAETNGGQTALVRIDQAIACYEKRASDVDEWVKSNRKDLRKGTRSPARYDGGARAAGRSEGAKLNVGGGSNARIGGGPKALGSAQ